MQTHSQDDHMTFVQNHMTTKTSPHLDDLPEQAEHEMGPPIHHVLGSDVDDVAADGAG